MVEPITKHRQARLLRDVAARKVRTDDNNRIWCDRRNTGTTAPRKTQVTPHVRAARECGWCTEGAGGMEELTDSGRKALAAWDAALTAGAVNSR